jgi:hypothetical protein
MESVKSARVILLLLMVVAALICALMASAQKPAQASTCFDQEFYQVEGFNETSDYLRPVSSSAGTFNSGTGSMAYAIEAYNLRAHEAKMVVNFKCDVSGIKMAAKNAYTSPVRFWVVVDKGNDGTRDCFYEASFAAPGNPDLNGYQVKTMEGTETPCGTIPAGENKLFVTKADYGIDAKVDYLRMLYY